ncbi:hypothetical protein RUM43_010002, partial [Polyplax serrata]
SDVEKCQELYGNQEKDEKMGGSRVLAWCPAEFQVFVKELPKLNGSLLILLAGDAQTPTRLSPGGFPANKSIGNRIKREQNRSRGRVVSSEILFRTTDLR